MLKVARSVAKKRPEVGACNEGKTRVVRGLLGTGPPGPTLESASPSPPRGSIWHRFNIDSTSIRHRFNIDSTSIRH